MEAAISVFMMISGMIFLLFGFALFRIWTAYCGFATGCLIAWLFVSSYMGSSAWSTILVFVCGGLLASVTAIFIRLGSCLSGAVVGFCLMLLGVYAAGSSSWPIAFTGAALGGVCAFYFEHVFDIAGTAAGGAVLLLFGLIQLVTGEGFFSLSGYETSGTTMLFVAFAVLSVACIGGGVQTALRRRRDAVDERTGSNR